ncbi:unnamed protein product [Microthlaspi erraticum]|uniref:DUF4283 domain-containing protein n=1 Tax=Microthlaspi erraticum TaxID=1685480 RepID=A0A6D2I7B5_9BRAS|nr:unnamed protein product [Microthlaspi erraticum]
MSNLTGKGRRGGSSNLPNSTYRRLDLEEEVIPLPGCDLTSAAEKFKNTLIGRIFYTEGRSMDAIIGQLPKSRIWDVEGRVQGQNLGNGQFQFDFDNEEDLQKVLHKRPWHFNRWSFSLERWEAFTSATFPKMMLFWVKVTGVPIHFWNDENLSAIESALGDVRQIEAHKAKFQVYVNADAPLKFEKKVSFPNGDVGTVTLEYEGLYRYCFTYKLLSHEEGTCPNLSEEQRQRNKALRAEQNGIPDRNGQNKGRESYKPRVEEYTDSRSQRTNDDLSYRPRNVYQEARSGPPIPQDYYHRGERRVIRNSDLRHELKEKRETRGKEVWNRIEKPVYNRDHTRGDRYHPYQRPRGGFERSNTQARDSHKVWRPKHPPRHGENFKTDTPHSHASVQNRDRMGAVSDSQRTTSEERTPVRDNNRRGSGHLIVYPKEPLEDSLRKLKGKAHVTETSRMAEKRERDIQLGRKIGSLTIAEPLSPPGRVIPTTNPTTLVTTKSIQPDEPISQMDQEVPMEEEDEGYTEAELMQMEAEFEAHGMDEQTMENDDLLGEELEADAEQTEAISQLSPVKSTSGIVKQKVVETSADTRRGPATRDQQIPVGQDTISARRKASTNPLIKANAASKKLQGLRIKASPKKKSGTSKQARPTTSKAQVPRNEVYPSALSRKPSTTLLGSVVSQKPPSKKI